MGSVLAFHLCWPQFEPGLEPCMWIRFFSPYLGPISWLCLYRRILRLRSRFPACVLAPNLCASLESVECLVTRSTYAQKPKFAANPWNTLTVSTEFPASASAEPWNLALTVWVFPIGVFLPHRKFLHCLLYKRLLTRILCRLYNSDSDSDSLSLPIHFPSHRTLSGMLIQTQLSS